MSNTLAAVEATDPVEWTRPGDLPYTPDGPLPPLGINGKNYLVILADGSVRLVPAATPAEQLHAGILINDNRAFNPGP